MVEVFIEAALALVGPPFCLENEFFKYDRFFTCLPICCWMLPPYWLELNHWKHLLVYSNRKVCYHPF